MEINKENIKASQAIKSFIYCCRYFKNGKCECAYDRRGNPYQYDCEGIKCEYVKDYISQLNKIVITNEC